MFRIEKSKPGNMDQLFLMLMVREIRCKGEKQKGIAKDSTGFLKTLFNVDVLKPVVFDYLFNKQKLEN